MNINIYFILFIILSLESFILFAYSTLKVKNSFAQTFSFLCLAMSIYQFFYAFELASPSGESIMFFGKLEYIGEVFMAPIWAILAYKFYYKKNINLKIQLLMFFLPFLVLLFALTNDLHQLFYREITIKAYDNFIIGSIAKGPVYYVHIFYSYILITYGQYLFIKSWKENKGIRKRQARLLFFSAFIPVLLGTLFLIKIIPQQLDPMPISFAVFSTFGYFVIFKYGFLEMREKIREISFEQISEGIFVTDYEGKLIDANITAKNIFSFLNNLGVSIFDINSEIFSNGRKNFELKIDNKYYEFKITDIIENNKKIGEIYIFQDVTEKKVFVEKLKHNAKYDFLSQLYNRHEFYRLSKIALKSSSSPVTVMLIDIDHFKNINDTYGHILGDLVIKKVASIIKTIGNKNSINGRFGGEEFILLLPNTDKNSAKIESERLRRNIEESSVYFKNITVKFTISIGVHSEDIISNYKLEELVHKADQALYEAKNKGRNRVDFYKSEENM